MASIEGWSNSNVDGSSVLILLLSVRANSAAAMESSPVYINGELASISVPIIVVASATTSFTVPSFLYESGHMFPHESALKFLHGIQGFEPIGI